MPDATNDGKTVAIDETLRDEILEYLRILRAYWAWKKDKREGKTEEYEALCKNMERVRQAERVEMGGRRDLPREIELLDQCLDACFGAVRERLHQQAREGRRHWDSKYPDGYFEGRLLSNVQQRDWVDVVAYAAFLHYSDHKKCFEDLVEGAEK